MNSRILALSASLLLSLGAPALAQGAASATHSVAQDAVGRWLHDAQGNTIGSVRSLSDDGRVAVVMVGTYFDPHSYEMRVPASALSEIGDKVVLRTDIVEALNSDSRN